MAQLAGGRPLIQLQAERFDREAELRYALVRLNEHVDTVAISQGEVEELRRLGAEFGKVLRMKRRIVSALARSPGSRQVTAGSPSLRRSSRPRPATSAANLLSVMMAVGAFIQVQQALRWFVDNFSTIAQWRATLSGSRASGRF